MGRPLVSPVVGSRIDNMGYGLQCTYPVLLFQLMVNLKAPPGIMYLVGLAFSDSVVVTMGKHFHKDMLMITPQFKNNTLKYDYKVTDGDEKC